MFTIDAGIFINAVEESEQGHLVSKELLDRLIGQSLPLHQPTLTLVEVAATISRVRNDIPRARALAAQLGQLPNISLHSLDKDHMSWATTLAALHSLKGADAVYVAVAFKHRTTLITRDKEILTRTPARIAGTLTPEALLLQLSS